MDITIICSRKITRASGPCHPTIVSFQQVSLTIPDVIHSSRLPNQTRIRLGLSIGCLYDRLSLEFSKKTMGTYGMVQVVSPKPIT
jgi:hypothetical protein